MNTYKISKCAVSQDGPIRLLLAFAILAVVSVLILSLAEEARAYDSAGSGRTCMDCHGRESDEASDTVAATRKGPHGRYDATTRKCASCHSVHSAAADGYVLLPAATAKLVCESCHDGTGGTGVYGAIAARGGTVRSAHRIDETNVIPGGDPSGGSLTRTFSGVGGMLTCVDCHSPHDTDTVEPFYGDRMRASLGSEDTTSGALPTNRLLRKQPGADYYGSDWCASCHAGYHLTEDGIDPVTGTANRHPVGFATEIESEWRFHYDNVRVVTSTESTQTTWGPLGGSNRGYVMPHESGNMLGHFGPQQGVGPLCQQCHEDARDVGGIKDGSPVLLPGQEFSVSTYPPNPDSGDNPVFQAFPHESDQPSFRVMRSDPDQPVTDGFCLRCHVPGS
ncbi:MAG: cytochrome c3 family protein [Coriobacteriia bacterium]|nr:cytochrome c3 family protein [Coriobacteriia bacterium]